VVQNDEQFTLERLDGFPVRSVNGVRVDVERRCNARVSVSNSWSDGDGELNEVPAVRNPAHMVQIGRDHRVVTGEVSGVLPANDA
jgi:hypothetical protein